MYLLFLRLQRRVDRPRAAKNWIWDNGRRSTHDAHTHRHVPGQRHFVYTFACALICKPGCKARRVHQRKNQGIGWRPATRDAPKEALLGSAAPHRARGPASSGKRNGLNDKAWCGTAIRRTASGGWRPRRAASTKPAAGKIGSDSHILMPASVLMERAEQCSAAQDRCARNEKRRPASRPIRTRAPIRQAGQILQTEARPVTQGIH
ncbi:hypothetical protein LMG28690_02038 [Paraburkholderia caffeinilytica]|nr:hypothetical protein LMG28690_02038 [Paraburkholderia caffeinilytica]